MPEKSLWCCVLVLMPAIAGAQMSPPATAATTGQTDVQMQRNAPMEQRIPQQKVSVVAALQGMVMTEAGLPLPGAEIRLVDAAGASKVPQAMTSGMASFGYWEFLRETMTW